MIERYVKKGSKLYIEGKLQTRKWTDNSGQDKYTTEVVLQGYGGNLTMLDGRNDGGGARMGGGGGYNQDSVAYGNQGQGGGRQSASAMEGPKENFDLDDEIPF